MTVPVMLAPSRAARRRRLLNLIAGASAELLELERADQRAARMAATIVEPSHDTIKAGTPSATRSTRVRAWARDHGYTVAAQGVIKRTVLDAYAAAHPDDPEGTP